MYLHIALRDKRVLGSDASSERRPFLVHHWIVALPILRRCLSLPVVVECGIKVAGNLLAVDRELVELLRIFGRQVAKVDEHFFPRLSGCERDSNELEDFPNVLCFEM
jgi:hypothetical protein